MITLSLLLNVVVLVPVTTSLLVRAPWVIRAYGDRSPARDILLAIYLAILAGSVMLLIVDARDAVVALLGVQIIYKVITAFTVQRALSNPVVLSNLGIAAIHAVTVGTVIVA